MATSRWCTEKAVRRAYCSCAPKVSICRHTPSASSSTRADSPSSPPPASLLAPLGAAPQLRPPRLAASSGAASSRHRATTTCSQYRCVNEDTRTAPLTSELSVAWECVLHVLHALQEWGRHHENSEYAS